MQSLISVVVLTLFATVACYEEFQCKFESDIFNLEKAGREENKHVWGSDVKPLEFKTDEEFESFNEKIVEAKRKIYEENLVNTIDSYYAMYDEARQYPFPDPSNNDYTSKVKKFSTSYHPKELHSDTLELLVKYLREIVEDVPEAKDHCFVGLYIIQGPNDEKINLGSNPPAQSDNEFPVGLIKVSVNGKLGYIVIDMELARTDLVMEDTRFPEASEITKDENPTKYQIGESKTFLEVSVYGFDESKESFVPPEKSDLIYVGKPLCSFVETHVRRTLLFTQVVSLMKYGDDFQLDGGLVAQLYHKNNTDRFRISYLEQTGDDRWEYDGLSFDVVAKLTADELEKFKQSANSIFGKTDEDENNELLVSKIAQLEARPYPPYTEKSA